ncbi:Gfo/Idh/MocA family protein [Paenibacillus sp. 1P07SE]|uniref:Gfo/Idh/MocA family protein n=1 Tax=Paenibacillus sp. 1P07SE TaxID=3132209 RepID=UPI0039A77B09
MQRPNYKVAVLGAGAIASHHFDAIGRTAGFEACAVADIHESRGGEIADRYGITAYRDYREMIEQERPDAAAIALPHYLHMEAAVFAAERGCHLMLEKPMALSTAECDRIMEAAQAANVRLLIGHTQHYMAHNLYAKQLVQRGEIGQVVMIHDIRHTDYFQPSRPDWFLKRSKSGGGILANLGTHSIDKIQWLTEGKVRKVSATISHHGSRGDVEGSGMIYLELNNGVSATIVQSGYAGAPRNETEIIGTHGMLKLRTGDSLWLSNGGEYKQLEVPHTASPFELQYAELLRAIQSPDNRFDSAQYGRGVLAVLEAVYRAAKTGEGQYV